MWKEVRKSWEKFACALLQVWSGKFSHASDLLDHDDGGLAPSIVLCHHLVLVYQQTVGDLVPPDQVEWFLQDEEVLNLTSVFHPAGLHGTLHCEAIVGRGDLLTFFVPAHDMFLCSCEDIIRGMGEDVKRVYRGSSL